MSMLDPLHQMTFIVEDIGGIEMPDYSLVNQKIVVTILWFGLT